MSSSGIELCLYPALEAPDGTASNFVDPAVNLNATLISVSVIMVTWGVTFVTGRMIINWRNLKLSDYFASMSLVLNISLVGVLLSMGKYMRHQYDVRACWFNGYYMKLNFAGEFVMPFAFGFSKAAILLMFLEIFTVDKKMRIAIYFGLAVCTAIYLQNVILVPYYTIPLSGETWDTLVYDPRVEVMTTVGIEQGVIAMLLDIYIFILPIPAIMRLKISQANRLRLIGVFGTAIAGVAASIVGLWLRIENLLSPDHTWSTARLYICIVVEVWVALIVATMPAFAHFLKVHISSSVFVQFLGSRVRLLTSKRGSRDTESTENSHRQSDETSEVKGPNRARSGRRKRRSLWALTGFSVSRGNDTVVSASQNTVDGISGYQLSQSTRHKELIPGSKPMVYGSLEADHAVLGKTLPPQAIAVENDGFDEYEQWA